MHELSILIETVRIVEELAEQHNIEKVGAIVLQIGELSSVVPQFMQEYFPLVVENKPIFKDTKLEIEILPGMAKCQECQTEFNVVENEGYCPKCRSFDKDLLCGQEFLIKEILVPNG
ncbi:MAG: hydrogenase nickel incorporation protein HypA [Firmicutes bacterium HGW-Firmicutes-16]|nr:MAG: hydrogenase nickel incorporation protein HypA [Firmicutes bacterium HGW-Firmicutes-16]